MAAIETIALRKKYASSQEALAGVSLRVDEGAIHALVGPNGAGKSSLVRILATLAAPDSGSARVAGHDVAELADLERQTLGHGGLL